MNALILFATLLVLDLMGPSGAIVTEPTPIDAVPQVEKVIAHCLDEYKHQSGGVGIDRLAAVYVHHSANLFGLAFQAVNWSEGHEYTETLFSCGVHQVNSLAIFYLGAPNLDPMIDSDPEGTLEKSLYAGTVQESVFRFDHSTLFHMDTRPLVK